MNTPNLFDREMPPEYLRESTERIAAEKREVEPGTSSAVVFRVAQEWLALPTDGLQEVAESCTLHSIPHRRGGMVSGLVTIRGELLLSASLAELLGIEKTPETGTRPQGHRILVANRQGNRLVFPVDEVHGVIQFHPRELIPVPATVAPETARFTTGLLRWQNRTVGYLDGDLLFKALEKGFA